MPDRMPRSLVIDISPSHARLFGRYGWWKQESRLLVEWETGEDAFTTADALAALLRRLLGTQKFSGMNTSIVLPNASARMFMISPPSNPSSLRDCRAAAELRFKELYPESLDAWQIEADWNALRPFLGCALSRSAMAQLRQISREYRLNLLDVAPRFVSEWNRWRATLDRHSWFAVAEDRSLTLGILSGKQLVALRGTQLPEDAWKSETWISSLLAREALRSNLPVPGKLKISGLTGATWPPFKAGAVECIRLNA